MPEFHITADQAPPGGVLNTPHGQVAFDGTLHTTEDSALAAHFDGVPGFNVKEIVEKAEVQLEHLGQAVESVVHTVAQAVANTAAKAKAASKGAKATAKVVETAAEQVESIAKVAAPFDPTGLAVKVEAGAALADEGAKFLEKEIDQITPALDAAESTAPPAGDQAADAVKAATEATGAALDAGDPATGEAPQHGAD